MTRLILAINRPTAINIVAGLMTAFALGWLVAVLYITPERLT